MPFTDNAKIYYPTPSQAPYTAADLQQTAEDVDKNINLTATDSADRDDRYPTIKPGIFVGSGASEAAWMKTPDGWLAIYEDTGEVTTGFTTPDNWSIGSYCFARRVNHSVEIAAELIYQGGDNIVANDHTSATPGNIPDQDVLYIPPSFSSLVGSKYRVLPYTTTWTSGTGMLYGNGAVKIRDMLPGSSITNGNFLRLSVSFLN